MYYTVMVLLVSLVLSYISSSLCPQLHQHPCHALSCHRDFAYAISSSWNSLFIRIYLVNASSASAFCVHSSRSPRLPPDSVVLPYCKFSLHHVFLLCNTSTAVVPHFLVSLCAQSLISLWPVSSMGWGPSLFQP